MKIIFQGDAAPGVTVVSNEFIDRYMPSANGAFVKVYLYLLRHRGEEVTDARIADSLELTEGDVKPVLPPAKLPDKSGVDFRRLQDDSEFAGLSYALQRYLGRTFSQTDTETVAYLYGTLGMSADLLIKLGEYCAEKKKSSLRYFEKVALDWYERGIRTPEEAEQRGQSYTKEVYAVLKAFGIRDRGPGVEEQKFIEKWYREYAFSEELVVEACSRTLRHVNKPSFPYADGILTRWHRAGVHSMQDIAEEDKKREETGRKKGAESGAKKNGTRFHNFEEREEDPNDLVLQQLKRKLEQES